MARHQLRFMFQAAEIATFLGNVDSSEAEFAGLIRGLELSIGKPCIADAIQLT